MGSPWHINKRGKAGGKQRDTHGEDGTGEPSYVAQRLVSAKRLPPRAMSLLPSSASSRACLLACFVEIMVSQGRTVVLPIASKSKIEHVDCSLCNNAWLLASFQCTSKLSNSSSNCFRKGTNI